MSKSPCTCCRFSCVRPFVTLWTIACQAPLSMGFSRQEYWSNLPFPTPVDLPDPGIEQSSNWQVSSLPPVPPERLPRVCVCVCVWVTQSCPVKCSLPTFLSIGFFGQEYWNVLPCPPPGIEPRYRNPERASGGLFIISATRKASGKPPKAP